MDTVLIKNFVQNAVKRFKDAGLSDDALHKRVYQEASLFASRYAYAFDNTNKEDIDSAAEAAVAGQEGLDANALSNALSSPKIIDISGDLEVAATLQSDDEDDQSDSGKTDQQEALEQEFEQLTDSFIEKVNAQIGSMPVDKKHEAIAVTIASLASMDNSDKKLLSSVNKIMGNIKKRKESFPALLIKDEDGKDLIDVNQLLNAVYYGAYMAIKRDNEGLSEEEILKLVPKKVQELSKLKGDELDNKLNAAINNYKAQVIDSIPSRGFARGALVNMAIENSSELKELHEKRLALGQKIQGQQSDSATNEKAKVNNAKFIAAWEAARDADLASLDWGDQADNVKLAVQIMKGAGVDEENTLRALVALKEVNQAELNATLNDVQKIGETTQDTGHARSRIISALTRVRSAVLGPEHAKLVDAEGEQAAPDAPKADQNSESNDKNIKDRAKAVSDGVFKRPGTIGTVFTAAVGAGAGLATHTLIGTQTLSILGMGAVLVTSPMAMLYGATLFTIIGTVMKSEHKGKALLNVATQMTMSAIVLAATKDIFLSQIATMGIMATASPIMAFAVTAGVLFAAGAAAAFIMHFIGHTVRKKADPDAKFTDGLLPAMIRSGLITATVGSFLGAFPADAATAEVDLDDLRNQAEQVIDGVTGDDTAPDGDADDGVAPDNDDLREPVQPGDTGVEPTETEEPDAPTEDGRTTGAVVPDTQGPDNIENTETPETDDLNDDNNNQTEIVPPEGKTIEIVQGDTLSEIVQREYGLSGQELWDKVAEVAAANENISDPNLIYAGNDLFLPGSESSFVPTEIGPSADELNAAQLNQPEELKPITDVRDIDARPEPTPANGFNTAAAGEARCEEDILPAQDDKLNPGDRRHPAGTYILK